MLWPNLPGLAVLLSVLFGTDGYYLSAIDKCRYSQRDLSDMEYIFSFHFNKIEFVRFSSNVGKYVGLTEEGVKQAAIWNNDTQEIQTRKAQLDGFCRFNAKLYNSAIREKSVPPRVQLHSVDQASGRHPAVLMCSAYNFFPKEISVTWLRNGEKVVADVISSEELADGDWFYQLHSHLEYNPKAGEKISCMVEHLSFSKPMIYDWDPSRSESETNKIAIGASGLVLGLIIAAAGLIYYKKKSSAGRILVPH